VSKELFTTKDTKRTKHLIGRHSNGVAVMKESNPSAHRALRGLRGEKLLSCLHGGPKRNRLFMAASQSIYAVYVNTQGAGPS
jgi:hypothetical protein